MQKYLIFREKIANPEIAKYFAVMDSFKVAYCYQLTGIWREFYIRDHLDYALKIYDHFPEILNKYLPKSEFYCLKHKDPYLLQKPENIFIENIEHIFKYGYGKDKNIYCAILSNNERIFRALIKKCKRGVFKDLDTIGVLVQSDVKFTIFCKDLVCNYSLTQLAAINGRLDILKVIKCDTISEKTLKRIRYFGHYHVEEFLVSNKVQIVSDK